MRCTACSWVCRKVIVGRGQLRYKSERGGARGDEWEGWLMGKGRGAALPNLTPGVHNGSHCAAPRTC